MKKVLMIAAMVVLAGGISNAQQTPLYSQYMFNKFLVNPAIAGAEGFSAVNLSAKEQWLGLKDAPSTQSISFQTRVDRRSFINKLNFLKSKYSRPGRGGNLGVGALIYNDKRGLLNQTGLQLTYAYHIEMDEMQLSFGFTTSFTQFSVNRSKLILDDKTDDLVDNSSLNTIIPDFNFGLYFTTPEYYVGFSATNLLESSVKFGNVDPKNFNQIRMIYLQGGYRFKLNRDYSIEPGAQIKTTESLMAQADLSVRGYYHDMYWGGISYRTGGQAVAMFGMRYNTFYFGYAFDFTFNKLQSKSVGSHELMITYKFNKSIRKNKWLERF